MVTLKYSNVIKKELFDLVENLIDNGGLCLSINDINYREDRLEILRKIISAINEEIDSKDELIDFLLEESKNFEPKSYADYAKNLFEIMRNENPEKIFLEQDKIRCTFLFLLPCRAKCNIYTGTKKEDLLFLVRLIMKNRDLLKVINMSINIYQEEVKRCKLGARKNLFRNYVEYGKEVHYILSKTINDFDENTSDEDIITSLLMASKEYNCHFEVKPQEILSLIIENSVYGMLHNNKKNIEKRIDYATQLLELLKKSYNECNSNLLDIIDTIRNDTNFISLIKDNNVSDYLKQEDVSGVVDNNIDFLDFIQNSIYNNPNYENCLTEYIEDQNLMKIILSYNDGTVNETEQEMFIKNLRDKSNKVEKAFDNIIKDLANDFDKVTNILWFRDTSLAAAKCMKVYSFEECKKLLKTIEQLAESIDYLVLTKLRTEKEVIKEKLSKMDFVVSSIKNNTIPKYLLNDIYVSVKNKLSKLTEKEERDGNINKTLINKGLTEYIDNLKCIIEQNLASEEKYQEYVRFETLRGKICKSLIENNFEDNQATIREIIVTMLNWEYDKINVLEYEIDNYQSAVERKIYCQDIENANNYKMCLIRIKRLQRLLSLILDCAKSNPHLIINEDFIDNCIKIEVAMQFLHENILPTNDDFSAKKIEYAEFIKKIFNNEKYSKYLNIDDFIGIVEEYNNDLLKYYEETNNSNNLEWRKRIIECNNSYTKILIKESISNSEKINEFSTFETIKNLIYRFGISSTRDEKEDDGTLSYFIQKSNQYFELFKKVFDFEIDSYNKAIAINDKVGETQNYRDCLYNVIDFRKIIIPLLEITKDLKLSDDEAKELTNNFIEVRKAINYLVYNNLSAESNIVLKKLEYIDYMQSTINRKSIIKNVAEIILNALKSDLDNLINKYEKENNSYELIFKSNERKYTDILESIIINNDYELYKNSEIIKNKIYSIAILNNSDAENIKSLIVKLKNFPEELFNGIVDNLIYIRRCICNINSDKITEDDTVKYEKQITSLENIKDKILLMVKNLTEIKDAYKLINSYDELKEALHYIAVYKLTNSVAAVNKKIEYIQYVKNILSENNFNKISAQILKKIKTDFSNILSDGYTENNDQSSTQFLNNIQIFDLLEELGTNIIDPIKSKKYLDNYKEEEEIKKLILLVLQNKDKDENTKELVKIALKNKRLLVSVFNCDFYIKSPDDDYKLIKDLLKNKILAIATYVNGYKDDNEFDTLFEEAIELYYKIIGKIKALTRNINSVYTERQCLKTYFYEMYNAFYVYRKLKMLFLCAMKDVAINYDTESKSDEYQNTAELAKLSLKKLSKLSKKIKESKDKDTFIGYIKEYEIIGYIESMTNHYYDNNKIKLINSYIEDKQLFEKAFDYVLKEAKEYDNVYDKQNCTENIIDFRDFIIKLANEVKDIDNIEERTAILYKKYFLKDYAGWNIYYGSIYNNLLKFDNKSIISRRECIHNYLFLIKKYKYESQINDILTIARNKLEKEVNEKISNRRNGIHVLYQDNTTMDIFDELCDNIKNKFLKDQKYLYDYYEDEAKLSCFHDNWINNGDYIEDKRYFVIEAIKDKNRIESLFNRYIKGYTHISKEYYLDSQDNYKYKVAIRRAEELKKEIFDVLEKVKDIEDKLEQESMINTLLITEEELKESFNNIFKFNDSWEGDVSYIDWNVGRFINLGFYYRNGKKELLEKIFKNKYDEIETNLNRSTDTYEIANLIFDKIQLDSFVKALLDSNYNSYCQIDKKITLLVYSLTKGIYAYDSPDTVMSNRNVISYHRGSIIKELIYTIKRYSITEFKRVVNIMLDSIDMMYKLFKDIKPINYEMSLVNNKDYPIHKKRIELVSNNVIKIYQLLEQISKNDYEFRAKLNDIVISLELLSQLELFDVNYNYIPISTIQTRTILDGLKDIIDRNSKDIFNLTIDIIISENQIHYEVFENERTLYFKPIEFFRNISNEIIKEY